MQILSRIFLHWTKDWIRPCYLTKNWSMWKYRRITPTLYVISVIYFETDFNLHFPNVCGIILWNQWWKCKTGMPGKVLYSLLYRMKLKMTRVIFEFRVSNEAHGWYTSIVWLLSHTMRTANIEKINLNTF